MDVPVFGYWPIRAYGQPIRYLMKYVGQPYTEKNYYQKGQVLKFGLKSKLALWNRPLVISGWDAPDFDKSDFRNIKDTLNLDFPNIPYYIDEKAGVRLSQSKAILLYLARKHNLVATKEEDLIRQDLVLLESMDLHERFFQVTYSTNFNEIREEYVSKELPKWLQYFEKFLGDRKFFVGNEVNVADFNVYEAIYVHTVLAPQCLDDFPRLKSFLERFEGLDGIKEFIASKDHLKEPVCSRKAFFSAGND